eukprot:GHVU01161541.1.p1 GENE.GHVU01161541.1~~GHVU01161541.1.p1  ORF type:complete len:127 (+),score=2.38 GHVU01161541.1:158-538(+)
MDSLPTEREATLEALPYDLFCRIFEYLGPATEPGEDHDALMTFARVAQVFRALVRNYWAAQRHRLLVPCPSDMMRDSRTIELHDFQDRCMNFRRVVPVFLWFLFPRFLYLLLSLFLSLCLSVFLSL